jgi:hypothetical protein
MIRVPDHARNVLPARIETPAHFPPRSVATR